MTQQIETFFDDRTWTLTYVVWDDETRDAVIIDPVLDYDPKASKVWTESAQSVIDFARGKELDVHYILETHAHADHLSGSQILKREFPEADVAIGERITEVQTLFKSVFDLPDEFPTDGRQFDRLLKNGEKVEAGSLSFEVIFTPGHTPACASYRFDDAVFSGDAIFMPDMGTGRCDFPGGSAEDLYESVHDKLYELPEETEIYVGHDYMPGGRDLEWKATVKDHRDGNVALPLDRNRDDFVAWRNERDSGLDAPQLLFQSVQVNVDAGALPEPSQRTEKRYLKIPINVFKPPVDDQALHLDEV